MFPAEAMTTSRCVMLQVPLLRPGEGMAQKLQLIMINFIGHLQG